MANNRNNNSEDFTLEKLKIAEKLDMINGNLNAHIQRFEHHCEMDEIYQKSLHKMVENHDRMLLGNNGTPGMKMELDRLTQKEKWRTTMYGAIWVAICGLMTASVWNVLTKGA